jgi:hypothetical protein
VPTRTANEVTRVRSEEAIGLPALTHAPRIRRGTHCSCGVPTGWRSLGVLEWRNANGQLSRGNGDLHALASGSSGRGLYVH